MRSGRRELSLESSVRFSNLVHVGRARGFQAHLAFFLSVGLQVSGGGQVFPCWYSGLNNAWRSCNCGRQTSWAWQFRMRLTLARTDRIRFVWLLALDSSDRRPTVLSLHRGRALYRRHRAHAMLRCVDGRLRHRHSSPRFEQAGSQLAAPFIHGWPSTRVLVQ